VDFDKTASIALFVIAYACFVLFPRRRSVPAIVCAGALVALFVITPVEAFWSVNWNVMGIFFGMLVLAELLMKSNMPAVLAEILVAKSPNAWAAMLVICAISSAVSVFAENVATVMLIAPIALETARKLKVSPVMLLVAVAISSNLQGTATLIGDPPSMILAGKTGMTFNDFFVYRGRLSIFFFVEAGAVFSFFVLWLFFRKHKEALVLERHEKLESWTPSVFMATLIVALVLSSYIDPQFLWLSGTVCMVWAAAGLTWYLVRHGQVTKLLSAFDWDTTFFLVGVFVLVETLTHVGCIAHITGAIRSITGESLAAQFFVLVTVSVVVSAFVDNVPYLVAMIPVAQDLATGPQQTLLLFGLLIASCIGGNMTPIGASANIVTVGYLRRQGHAVTFRTFMKLGVPFTVVATAAASVFLWIVWG